MAPRNSTTLILRALVMLGCLVALPTWALWGTSLPERIEALLRVREQLLGNTHDAEMNMPSPFAPGTEALVQGTAANGQVAPVDSSGATVLSELAPPRAGRREPPPGVVPAHFESATIPSTVPSATKEPTENQILKIQNRLRQLGATYFRLETWGDRGELFRFQCKVAVHGSAAFTRHFENTDPHPLKAMNGVLEEVEAWRAGL